MSAARSVTVDREARNNAPPPDIAYLRRQGVVGARISCKGEHCGRTVTVPFDKIGLPEDTPFPQIARLRKWVCQKCGSREVSVMPDWRDPRTVQEERSQSG